MEDDTSPTVASWERKNFTDMEDLQFYFLANTDTVFSSSESQVCLVVEEKQPSDRRKSKPATKPQLRDKTLANILRTFAYLLFKNEN